MTSHDLETAYSFKHFTFDRLSPDFLAPPSTDAGSVENAKWPFSLSHNRLQTGGWARQQNGLSLSFI